MEVQIKGKDYDRLSKFYNKTDQQYVHLLQFSIASIKQTVQMDNWNCV